MNRNKLLLIAFVGVLLASTALGVVFVALAASGGGIGVGSRLAIIEIEGVLIDDEELLEQIRRFREDPTVAGFVISIDSPGGVVASSQSVYRALRAIREEDGRPVIASIGSVGASGGYYVALAADSIFALPGSITGSIGVIMEFPNAAELMDRIGVRMETVQSSEHKDIGSPFREMSETDRTLLSGLVQDVYQQFVDVVAAERAMPREDVLAIADGRLFSGRQALSQGLIDAEGGLEDAIAAAGRMADLGDTPRVVRPPEPGISFLDLLLAGPGSVVQRVLGRSAAAAGPTLKFVPAFGF